MDFASFMNDPKSYLKAHAIPLSNNHMGAGSVTEGAPVLNHGSPRPSILFTWNGTTAIKLSKVIPGQSMTPAEKIQRLLTTNAPQRLINYGVTATGGADNGFRYLPFRQNNATYMRLDGTARFCITGPLTGCTVAVGRDNAGVLWFFHSNENDANGHAARSRQLTTLRGICRNQVTVNENSLQLCEMT